MSLEESGRLEEERRLAYVGVTRAMQQLVLTLRRDPPPVRQRDLQQGVALRPRDSAGADPGSTPEQQRQPPLRGAKPGMSGGSMFAGSQVPETPSASASRCATRCSAKA